MPLLDAWLYLPHKVIKWLTLCSDKIGFVRSILLASANHYCQAKRTLLVKYIHTYFAYTNYYQNKTKRTNPTAVFN